MSNKQDRLYYLSGSIKIVFTVRINNLRMCDRCQQACFDLQYYISSGHLRQRESRSATMDLISLYSVGQDYNYECICFTLD